MAEPRRGPLVRGYQKWKKVAFSDRLNVSIGIASLLVGVMAIVLTVVSLRMGYRQEEIAKRQTQIAETQHQILQKQLGLEANVEVSIGWMEDARRVQLILQNHGLVPIKVDALGISFEPAEFRVSCEKWPTREAIAIKPVVIDPANSSRDAENGLLDTSTIVLNPESTNVYAICEVQTPPGTPPLTRFFVNWSVQTKNRHFQSARPSQEVLPAGLFETGPNRSVQDVDKKPVGR